MLKVIHCNVDAVNHTFIPGYMVHGNSKKGFVEVYVIRIHTISFDLKVTLKYFKLSFCLYSVQVHCLLNSLWCSLSGAAGKL